MAVAGRTVADLLDRHDELPAVAPADDRRLRKLRAGRGRVVPATDGLQPDVGHEVLWVVRDVPGGEALLARSLPSARRADLAERLGAVRDARPVPAAGRHARGRHPIRRAVGRRWPRPG